MLKWLHFGFASFLRAKVLFLYVFALIALRIVADWSSDGLSPVGSHFGSFCSSCLGNR